jgi:membrane protease YdiL (CAAX protease family)
MNTHKIFRTLSIAWMKLPLILRAILVGFTVSTIGVLAWVNVGSLVPMPWTLIAMAGLLWLYWKYLSGSGPPGRTKAYRVENFRRQKLPAKAWGVAMLAGLLIVLIEQSGLVFTFRLVRFPAEQFVAAYSFLDNYPLWAAWLIVVMISVVAGICEEIGFRGYMQVPLEKRYGPIVGIAIVSIVFVLVHLHQAWSGPILAQIFIISALFGTLAYASRSLIPGIAAHIVMDIFNFSYWWTNIGWQFDKAPISVTGIDLHFIVWTLILIGSTLLFVLSIARLRALSQQHSDLNAAKTLGLNPVEEPI